MHQHKRNTKTQCKNDKNEEAGASTSIFESLEVAIDKPVAFFEALTPSQQAWLIATCIGALLILPRLILLVIVAGERLLIGGLLATEAVVGSLLLRSAAFIGALAALGLVLWGIKAFVIDGKGSSSDRER
jgi:hypothetical protein